MKITKVSTSKQKGFTLIELLIVIAIIGILAMLGIASYTISLQQSRDSKRKNDLRQIGIALESYNADKGQYPLGDGNGSIVGCGSLVSACTWGGPFSNGASTIYMTQLPQDVSSSQQYYYVSDGTKYQIYAHLEYSKDIAIKSYSGPKCIGTDPNSCNYGIASTNTSP